MYVIDIKGLIERGEEPDKIIYKSLDVLQSIYGLMGEEETVWVFCPTSHYSEGFHPVGMMLADELGKNSDFYLKNIISRIKPATGSNTMADAYEEILLLVKELGDYYFDKDSIRIEHVYQGEEWNGRNSGESSYHDYEVRRYNPDGKDPGNLWLREIRTDTPDETLDRTLPLSRSEALQRCIMAGSRADELISVFGSNGRFDHANNGSIEEQLKVEERDFEYFSFSEY